MSHPQSYEILLVPEFKAGTGAPEPGAAIRSGVVAATGDTGASGYPRYAGDGMEADIDPATHTVEALLVDGAELDYALSARIAEKPGAAVRQDAADDGTDAERPGDEAAEPAGREAAEPAAQEAAWPGTGPATQTGEADEGGRPTPG